MLKKSTKDIQLLFETSWEVCNKIGGIYTVLSTKARELQKIYPDKVVFIGPDVWSEENPSPTFIEKKTLLHRAASKINLPYDIKLRVGRWDIPGSPIVVLVSFHGVMPHLNEIYGDMWARYGVDSIHAYGDYDESCAFAVASAITLKAISEHLNVEQDGVVAHFDEWTTGMGLLYTKAYMPEAATVFTTHATSIGRSICGNGKNLYQYFEHYNGDQMARELNMEAKHSLEKRAAQNADCFTTVSEVTAKECAQLLDTPVDVVTPNGFEPDFVPASTKYNRQRKQGRKQLLNIGSLMAGASLPEDTFIIATSGRNEYRNKGIDLYLDSMARLGNLLAEKAPEKKVLALVTVPAWVKEPNGDLLVDLHNNGTLNPNPNYLTHRLNNEDYDLACRRIAQLSGENATGNVKLLFVPCYLDGHDGIVDIAYYDFLPALDLTLFPSYYEPWGYTPLESVAFGVPTITTDKAGFGQWALSVGDNTLEGEGVKTVDREDEGYQKSLDLIAETALQYILADNATRTKAREAATATSRKADWQFFIKDYQKAYEIALKNRNKREK